jgi:hypothetical protein
MRHNKEDVTESKAVRVPLTVSIRESSPFQELHHHIPAAAYLPGKPKCLRPVAVVGARCRNTEAPSDGNEAKKRQLGV